MLKYLLFLSLILNALNASNTYYEHRVSQFKMLSKQQDKKIVMIGDSITDRGLWSELTNRHDIINRGISGDTTDGVLYRLDTLNSGLKQAFIMIGVNDLFKGRSVQEVFANYKQIIITLQKKNILPFIQSTLYVGADAPPIYNDRITQLNSLLLNYAIKHSITYIDLNKYLSPKRVLSKRFSSDNLHLNGEAYLIWARVLKKYVFQ